MKRDSNNPALVKQMLASQWPLEKKRQLADEVILNTESQEKLEQSVEDFYQKLKDVYEKSF